MRRSDDQALPQASQIGPVLSELLSVANIAALAPLTYGDGTGIYVRSVRDYFVYRASSTATVDGITVAAHSTGTGRWERLNIPHPSWAYQGDWAVSPASGNDENAGTAASPLKSVAELRRRWGADPNLHQFTAVQILDELPDSDPVCLDVSMAPDSGAVNTSFVLQGPIPTALATGAVTTWTALNRATPSWNTLVTTGFDFSAHVAAGTGGTGKQRMLRFTSGPAAGYAAWIDSAPSLGTVVLGSLQIESNVTSSSSSAASTINPTPVAGNTWEIVEFVGVPALQVNLRARALSQGATAGGAHTFTFQRLSVRKQLGNSLSCPSYIGAALPFQGNIVCERMDLRSTDILTPTYNVFCFAYNCHFFGSVIEAGYLRVNAGRTGNPAGSQQSATIISAGVTVFDGDFMFTTRLFVGQSTTGQLRPGAACRLGTVGFKVTTASSDAVTVGHGGVVDQRAQTYAATAVYGTATGCGVKTQNGGRYYYLTTKPSINAGLGGARETIVHGVNKLYSEIPFADTNSLTCIAAAV